MKTFALFVTVLLSTSASASLTTGEKIAYLSATLERLASAEGYTLVPGSINLFNLPFINDLVDFEVVNDGRSSMLRGTFRSTSIGRPEACPAMGLNRILERARDGSSHCLSFGPATWLRADPREIKLDLFPRSPFDGTQYRGAAATPRAL